MLEVELLKREKGYNDNINFLNGNFLSLGGEMLNWMKEKERKKSKAMEQSVAMFLE